jgi:hypothetical protein
MAAVDYDVGRRDLGSLYTNLLNALRNRGDAENKRKAEDIERRGLFGTGIKSSDLQDLAKTGMGFMEFGEGRKERKMARATKSFDARMKQAKERIIELRRFGDDDSINEIRAIQAGMNEERNKFENLMSDYEELGVWESGLGGKGVGYKDTGEMSEFAKAMMKRGKKTGDGDAFDRWGDRADAFAQDEASYDYEENPYAGKFGLPGDSDMRDFAKPLPEDYQPDTYGAPIETDGDDWERSGQRRRNYIENRGPLGKMAKPYNRYGTKNSFSADTPGMMSTKEDDFLRYEDWKAFR